MFALVETFFVRAMSLHRKEFLTRFPTAGVRELSLPSDRLVHIQAEITQETTQPFFKNVRKGNNICGIV